MNYKPLGSVTLSMLNRAHLANMLELVLMPDITAHTSTVNDDLKVTWFDRLNDNERADEIEAAVNSVLNYEQDKTSRRRNNVTYRQMLAYFLHQKTSLPWREIGEIIGNKNHATAIWAYRKATEYMETDKEYRALIDKINTILT